MIPVTENKTEYAIVPAGNHVARVYSIIHIGTSVKDTQYGPRTINAVRVTWELPNETKEFKDGEGERPFSISEEYNLVYGEKSKLRSIVEGMKADIMSDDGFMDIEKLMGTVCLLNIQHKTTVKGTTYANVVSAAPLPKGMNVPDPVNDPFILNYTDKWSQDDFDKLPDFLKGKMYDTDEYKKKFDTESTVPF